MQLSPKQENIRVIIRLRPLSEEEFSSKTCIKIETNSSNTLRIESQQEAKFFTSDYLADENVNQQEMYSIVAKPIVESCIQGYNCCILAYGQTGSGKTHTMIGPSSEESLGSQEKGLIFRALEHLFEAINANPNPTTQFLLKISFLEIYNEQIIDLLTQTSRNLLLREDLRKGVYVECLSEENPSSPAEAFEILKKGARNRHIGATAMNFESSRSHSVFSITLESRTMNNGLTSVRSSRFNFVDLAGSERQKHDIQQERFKEGCNINKSLHVLGKVINSLSESTDRKTRYIPYRDSKLTFLLKDSLGGNSKCTLIANINPNSLFFNESVSTLKFAQRAKMIKNDVLINEEASGNIECLKLEIRRLKEQILRQNLMESQLNDGQLNVPLNAQSNLILNAPLNIPLNSQYNVTANGQLSVPLNVQLANLSKVNAGIIEIEKTMKSYLEQSVECEGGMRLEIERMREEIERAREGLEKAERNEIQMRLVLGLMQERLKRKGDDPEYGDLVQKETQILQKLLNTPLLTRIFKENLMLRENTNKTDLTKLLKNSIENQLNLANVLGQEVDNRRRIADHLLGSKEYTSEKENKELLEKLDICNQELNEFKIKDSENMAICENMALQIQTLEEELTDCRSQLIKQNNEFSSDKRFQELNLQISHLQNQNKNYSAKILDLNSLTQIKEVNMNRIFEESLASYQQTGFLQNHKMFEESLALASFEAAAGVLQKNEIFEVNLASFEKPEVFQNNLVEILGGRRESEECEHYLEKVDLIPIKSEEILGLKAQLKIKEEEFEVLSSLIRTKEESWREFNEEKEEKIKDLKEKNEFLESNMKDLEEDLDRKRVDILHLSEIIKEMEALSENERNRLAEEISKTKGALTEKIEELMNSEVAFKSLSDEYSELLERSEEKAKTEAEINEETELVVKQLNEQLLLSNKNEANLVNEAANLKKTIAEHERTIENLANDMTQYRYSNETLSIQMKNSAERLVSLESNIETLEKTIHLKENQVRLLESQFMEGTGKIEGVMEENERLIGVNGRLIGVNEDLHEELDGLKKELADQKEQCEQYNLKLELANEQIGGLTHEIEEKSSEIVEVNEKVERLFEEKGCLLAEKEVIKDKNEEMEISLNELRELYKTSQNEIKGLRGDLEERSNEINELKDHLTCLVEEKETMLLKSNENQVLSEQMDSLLKEKESLLMKSEEISDLQAKINILLDEKEVLAFENETMTEKYGTIQHEYQSLQTQFETLILDSNQLNQENLQKQAQISTLTDNHLKQSQNDSIVLNNMKNQLQLLSSEKAFLSNENTCLNQKHLQALQNLATSESTSQALKQDLISLKATSKSTSQALKQDLLSLNHKYQEKIEEIDQLNTLLSENQQTYSKLSVENQAEISSLTEKLEVSQKNVLHLENGVKHLRLEQENEISHYEEKISELNVLLSENQQTCSTLSLESQAKIAGLNEKLEESQKSVLLMKNEADRFKLEQEEEFSHFERRIWELEADRGQKDLLIEELTRNSDIKLEEVSILFEELKEKHDDLKDKLDKKVREATDLSISYEESKNEILFYRNSQTQREEEISFLKRNLLNMEESYDNLQKEISKLKATYKERLNELVSVKESKQKIDLEAKELENKLFSTETVKTGLLRTVSELEAKLVELAERSEGEVKALKASLSDRNSEISIIKTTLTDKIGEISNLRLNLADKGSEVGSLRKELDNFKKRSEEKISELLLLRKELDLIKKRAERELEEEKLHFEEAINQKEFQIDEISKNKDDKVQELTQEIDKLKKIINNIKKQNEQLERDSFETTRKLSDDHLKKNVKLLKENEKLKEDLKSLKSLHLDLQRKDETLFSEKIKDFQRKEEARFSDKLSEKLIELQKKEEMLKNLHETAKEYCRNQEVELNAIRKDYSLLEEEKRVLSDQLGTALGEKEKGRKENQVLVEKINRMNSDKYLLLKEIEVLNKANEGVSEEKSRLLNKLKEENNKLKEEKKQLLDSLSLEAEKNRRNSRKSFQPNENTLNNLEEIQNELEKKNMMVRDYNDNLNRLTTLLNLNNPLKPRILTTGIKHNLSNNNSFENIIKEVSCLISNVSDKDSKIKDKEREIDTKNLKFSLMEKEYFLQKQRFALSQNNSKLKAFENNENDQSNRENTNNNRSISPIGVNRNREDGKGKFKSSEKNYFVLYK